MGWLEVLALLKRIAPLLGRLAPMLETLLANRMGSRADTDALERLSGELRGQLAATGEQHGDLAEAVRTQAALLHTLAGHVERSHAAGQAAEIQLAELRAALASQKRRLLTFGSLLVLLLAVCLVLLVRLLLHRPT